MIVDAHQHYWRTARGDYAWLAAAPAALSRDWLPVDLMAERNAAGVNASVLVQAAPTEAETHYLLELAREDTGVAGVVGWVDFEAFDVQARIRRLVHQANGLLVGLRPMAQDIADPDWLDKSSLDAAFEALQQHGLAFDALVTAAQLPALGRRLAREPDLRAVLDHAGKPDMANGDFRAWADQIDRLADRNQLYCKFSGLLTQLSPTMPNDAIDSYVQYLFARFGGKRLMWGSDWPVLTLRGDYGYWLTCARTYTRTFAPALEADVFGGNAHHFYRLDIAQQTLPITAIPHDN